MTITVYTSNDASAPSLTGVAGSLIAVLDGILVTGYGSKAAAGWTKPFTGAANQAVYRPATQDRLFLNVDDTTAHFATLIGYETMTAYATGTGLFPTAVQVAAGLFCMKSSTATATVRPWLAIADGAAIHFYSFCAQTTLGATSTLDGGFDFGPLKSYKAGDVYSTTLIASTVSTIAVANGQQGACRAATSFAGAAGHYTARSYTQLGTSVNTNVAIPVASVTSLLVANVMNADSAAPAYPDPVSGGLALAPVLVQEAANVYRGQLPGTFWAWASSAPLNVLDTLAGSGDYAGVSFIAVQPWSGASSARLFIQTSGVWY